MRKRIRIHVVNFFFLRLKDLQLLQLLDPKADAQSGSIGFPALERVLLRNVA